MYDPFRFSLPSIVHDDVKNVKIQFFSVQKSKIPGEGSEKTEPSPGNIARKSPEDRLEILPENYRKIVWKSCREIIPGHSAEIPLRSDYESIFGT